jgi:SAM-dependent MidA family methyltransferase
VPSFPPPPGAEARAVSDTLLEKITRAIEQRGGCLPFDTYMNMALYEPGLGYYSNGGTPFGEQGDFVTAPESGDLFGRCLANAVASVLQQVDHGCVLELGAGSGALARVLLQTLEGLGALPERYFILERSGVMRGLQQQALAGLDRLAERVVWLDAPPPQPINGVVFGNEVADALPVRRFRWHDGEVTLQGVACENNRLAWCDQPADDETASWIGQLARDGQWQGVYTSEYCPGLKPWVQDLAACIAQGALLLIDYGYGRAEYYHPQRSMGTLLCHYRHQAHDDALWCPGLQDITAFVDFTSIAEAATDAGMRFVGYTSQAQFLAGCGIDTLLAGADPQDHRRFLQLSNETKRLMLPGEMGERFKAIGFSRDLERDVVGFALRDLRSRL